MRAVPYTLLYVVLFLSLFAGCITHKRDVTCAEKQRIRDSLQTIVTDSLLMQHLHQSSARMEMRLQHISFTKPDSLKRQYLQSVTLLDVKTEEKDTSIQQIRQVGRAETEYIRNLSADTEEAVRMENEPFRMKWGYLLIFVLFFITLISFCYPAIKRVYDKILSK